MFMKKLVFIFCFVFVYFSGYRAQKINQAEFDFLIKKTTKNKNEQEILQKIHENIIRSEYDEALKLIHQYEHNQQISFATSTYLASIEYVKSNYERSLKICDSLISSSQNKYRPIYLVRAMNYKAKALSAMGKQSEAIEVINKSIDITRKTQDRFQQAMSYYYKGVFISEIGDFKKAIKLLQKSKNISHKLNDKLNLAATSSFIGYCFSHEGKYSEAIEMLNQSILIRVELGDKRGLANSYLNLNKVYLELNDPKKRFEYENKSLKICNEIGDLQCISGRLTNIGDIFYEEGKLDLALKYQRKAHEISKKIGINYRVAEIHQHIAEIFNKKEKYNLALAYIDSSIQIRRQIKENEGVANSQIIKADILLKWGKINFAKKTAIEALKIAESYNLIHIKRDGHFILSQILEKNGDGQLALTELKTYHLFKDSLLNIDKSKLILRKELEENFKLKELNNKKIQSENQLKLKQEKAQRRNLIFIGISIIALLIIFAYLIFLKYQSQKKINDVVTQNQALTKHLSNLEKESIFSQTIFSIAHELNTPLGVIKAGTGEMAGIIEEFKKSTSQKQLNDKTAFFLEKWNSEFKNEILIGGRALRKKKQTIFEYLSIKFKGVPWDLDEISQQIAELNLTDNQNEFINELFELDKPQNVLIFLINTKKTQILENAISSAISTTQKVVQEMNQLAEMQTVNETLISFEVKPVINQIFTLNQDIKKNNIQLITNLKEESSLFFDKDRFIQILSIIIQNAIESFENGNKNYYIKIDDDSVESYNVITISNNGIPIPEAIQPQIFERFTTTKNRNTHRGLGLSIVKSTLESYGAFAEVSSSETETSFKLFFKKKS